MEGQPKRASALRVRAAGDAGPPLPLVASISVALVVAGIVVPLLLSGGQAYPSPSDEGEGLASYVASYPAALKFAALFQFAASVPLAVFSASVVARLHALGVRAAGPMIALVGGVCASIALALSASGQWVLSGMSPTSSTELLEAVRDLVFIAGGPWHVVAFGLLLAGISVSAAFHRLLPRPMWIAGVVLAVVCELATLAFATTQATYLVPLGRFGGLLWLVGAAVLLPRKRPRRATAPTASSADQRAGDPGLTKTSVQ